MCITFLSNSCRSDAVCPKNKLVWRAKITLGTSKLNSSRQYEIISILLVLNNFIKNLHSPWMVAHNRPTITTIYSKKWKSLTKRNKLDLISTFLLTHFWQRCHWESICEWEWFLFPPHLTSVSALPQETQKREKRTFSNF